MPLTHEDTMPQLELHTLALLRQSSHHLPNQPPKNHSACLSFRLVSHRLLFWDRLHHYRTGQEYLFQNYYRECPIGPELLWAIYPRYVDHATAQAIEDSASPSLKQVDQQDSMYRPPSSTSSDQNALTSSDSDSASSPPPPPPVFVMASHDQKQGKHQLSDILEPIENDLVFKKQRLMTA